MSERLQEVLRIAMTDEKASAELIALLKDLLARVAAAEAAIDAL